MDFHKYESTRVSIVTPTYNQAKYLAATIESVLAQDYLNLEYIVLDDGSTDNTQEILIHYSGRLRVACHANQGQASTLNLGWSISTGSLLGYLSSDDLLHPDAVSRLVDALDRSPHACVAYGDFDLIDTDGNRFRTVRSEDFDVSRLSVDLVCQPGPGALFRRSVFEQTGGWTPHLRQIPDFEFWLRASKLGPFIRVPQVLAQYRIHSDSASFRPVSEQRSMEIVDVMSKFWSTNSNPQGHEAIANAFVVAARYHAHSGRPQATARCLALALRLNWRILFASKFWRTTVSGLLRRMFYRFRIKT